MDELHDTLRQLVKTHEEAYLKEVEETRRLRKIIEDKKFPENVRQAEYAKMLEAAEVRIQEIVEERCQEVVTDLERTEEDLQSTVAANERLHRELAETSASRVFWIFASILGPILAVILHSIFFCP